MIPGPLSERALVHAPNGRDGRIAIELLHEAGLRAELISDFSSIEPALKSGAGLAVISEEAILHVDLVGIALWVKDQPAWSDFPFVILTRRGGIERNPAADRFVEALGNVSFLERPFHPTSFVSSVRTAVRARKRQYEARARLEELKDRQERFRFAQEAGDIGTFELMADTRALEISQQFARIWGLGDRSSVMLDELIAMVEPDDRTHIRTNETTLTRESLAYTEYRIRRADTGEIRWIARRGEALPDTSTGKNRFFGVTYDITERKRAELALRDREAFTRLLIDSTTEAFYALDTQGTTTLCNSSFLQLLGFKDDAEVIGRKLHDVIHHSHPDGSVYPVDECPIFRAAATGSTAIVDNEFFFHQNGRRIPVEYRAAPIFVGGVLQGAICTFVDITERRRAADELMRLNATLEQRVEERTRERDRMWRISSDLMDVRDPSGQLLAVNQAWTTLLGWSESELLATNALALAHPEDIAATAAIMLDLATLHSARQFENRCRHRDGSYRLIFWTAVAEQGLLYAVGRDITQQRETQDALRQSQKMEAVGQLTGGIAHDFNNLLQSIISSLDMLRSRAEQGQLEGMDRFIALASGSANKAASLVHHLLAFSRRQPLSPRSLNANSLIASMEDLLRRTLGLSILLDFQLSSELWNTLCDPNQLESAILNLAINARDAMPAGGTLRVQSSNSQLDKSYVLRHDDVAPGEYVCVAITDSGSGMSRETMAKAFEPFFTTKSIGEGTGLGLSMVYGFARQSGGHAEILSTLGQGTTIKLYLPRSTAVIAEAVAETAFTQSYSADQGQTVLIVEDEPSIRDVTAEVLSGLGFCVVQAEDAPTALKVLESDRRLDLMLTDIGLPGMNGRDLANRARILRPQLFVIFMTGYAESATAAHGFLDEKMLMITKPFPLSALVDKVQEILRKQ